MAVNLNKTLRLKDFHPRLLDFLKPLFWVPKTPLQAFKNGVIFSIDL